MGLGSNLRFQLKPRDRHGEGGFTMLDLIIALALAGLLGIAAYKVVISSTRQLQSVERQRQYLFNLTQIEGLLKEDLRKAIPVSSVITPVPTDVTPPDSVIRSGFTPLISQDVDGAAPPSQSLTGIAPADINAIRIVIPDTTLTSQASSTTTADMGALLTSPVPVTNPIMSPPGGGAPLSIFQQGHFVWIGQGSDSDVFLLTNNVNTMYGTANLEHSALSSTAGANRWNASTGLSTRYYTGAVVDAVQVVTLGIRFLQDGVVRYQPFLVRKSELLPNGDTILGRGFTSFKVRYFGSENQFPPEGCEIFSTNSPGPPANAKCTVAMIPFIEKTTISLSAKVGDTVQYTEFGITPRNSFKRKAFTQW